MQPYKSFIIIFFTFFLLSACDSKKKDANKLAELFCKAQQLKADGKEASPDYIKIEEDSKALTKKIDEKYDPKDKDEIFKIFLQDIEKCKPIVK